MSALSARLAWPWRRPRVGIAFSPRWLLAIRAGSGNGAVLRDLPPGLLVPSAVVPNIQSVREVARLASEMVEELGGRGSTAAVLLPDLAVVSAVFPASNGSARDAGARLASRLGFPASEARSDFWKGGQGELLGAAVRESVVRQYEQVVEAAQCRLGWVDAASLARVPSWADKSASDPGPTVVEALLFTSHYFLAIFRDGALVDVRTRLRSGNDVEEIAGELGRLPAIYGIPALAAVRLAGEGASDCARALLETRIETPVFFEDGGEKRQLEASLAALLSRS
jgi:hypothetical protein